MNSIIQTTLEYLLDANMAAKTVTIESKDYVFNTLKEAQKYYDAIIKLFYDGIIVFLCFFESVKDIIFAFYRDGFGGHVCFQLKDLIKDV